MKFLLAILLVASCQAFSIESLIEKEAFKFAVHEAVDELERTAVSELKNALLGEGRGISESDVVLIHTVATVFGKALSDEVYKVFTQVTDAGDMHVAIIQKLYERLRQAATDMADGLHLTPKIAEEFLTEMMHDIKVMEESGDVLAAIEHQFENIFTNAVKSISYASIEKRSLLDIFGKINETLRRIVAHLHGKFHDLHNFLQSIIKDKLAQLKPKIDNIKILAKDFIANIKMVSAKVAIEALEFFKPWRSLLGSTWNTLVKDIHDRLQKLNPATPLPHTTTIY